MGFCVSYDELVVTHKGENAIRDILRAFKSKTYPIETLAQIILANTEQNERQNVYYEYLLNNYHNPYYAINQSIINIPNNTNVVTNEQYMLTKLIPLSQSANTKVLFVKEYFNINTFQRFVELCDVIWRNVLIRYNEVILECISDSNCTIKEKDSMSEIIREVYNEDNYMAFYEGIKDQWLLVLNKDNENDLKECNEFWEYLKDKYDFCFNAIELRHFFYLKFYGR